METICAKFVAARPRLEKFPPFLAFAIVDPLVRLRTPWRAADHGVLVAELSFGCAFLLSICADVYMIAFAVLKDPSQEAAMLIARWQIDARFGHKQAVIDSLKKWSAEIAPQAGLTRGRLLTGSIGMLEATVEHNWEVESLDELERAWSRLGAIPEHAQWSKDLEPDVVSGTARWSVLRVV